MLRSTLALLTAAGLLAVPTPSAAQTASDTPDVRPARLLADLEALAHDSMRGRAAGTAGAEAARTLVVARLRAAGAEPVRGEYLHPFTWEGGSGANVLARLPGTDAAAATIVLGAHYDHLGTRDGVVYNGADDNASGTAALLEVARIVSERPLRHDVLLAAFDAEESGLRGARAFVEAPPEPLEEVALMINLDMVARTDGVLWAAGAHHTPALRPVLERVAEGAPLTLRLGHDRPGQPDEQDWTGASDHGPFHRHGVPFVYFGVEDHPDYHRPTDDFDRVNPAEYVAAVETIVAALYALDAALPLTADRGTVGAR